jgi:large subunit ribosomal protein L6
MSRIGRKPIVIPSGVTVTLADGNILTVKGPKGTLNQGMHKDMIIKVENNEILVSRPTEEKKHKALHGLTRTLIANMIDGVVNGFSKNLEVNGVGYRAQKQGNQLVMNLGYSHQVIVDETDGIKIDVPSPNKITITGIDKQKVGQFAAEIREKRPPEPYKGKGIKYAAEVVRRKEGKTGGKGGKK